VEQRNDGADRRELWRAWRAAVAVIAHGIRELDKARP
jgi:hypothetical protein